MVVKFTLDKIEMEEKDILYSDFEKEDGYKMLIELLQICVINKDSLQFICDEDCPPFGKKLKEIIASEFEK